MVLFNGRDIRLVCFDVDGTLVEQTIFIWQTLHSHFGSDPERRARAKGDFFAGHISYKQWFDHDIQLLQERGADRAGIDCVLDSLRPSPGALETLCQLKRRGYRLAVISGSVDVVVQRFFADAPLDHVLINRLFFDENDRLCGGQATPYDMAGKADGLIELARREGLSVEQCAFVGDNTNDLDVMKVAGFSIGVHIKHSDVEASADLVLEDPDLRSLLPLFPEL